MVLLGKSRLCLLGVLVGMSLHLPVQARGDESRMLPEAAYLHAMSICRIEKGEAPSAVWGDLLATAKKWGVPSKLLSGGNESIGAQFWGKELLRYLGPDCQNPDITQAQADASFREATKKMNQEADRLNASNARKQAEVTSGPPKSLSM